MTLEQQIRQLYQQIMHRARMGDHPDMLIDEFLAVTMTVIQQHQIKAIHNEAEYQAALARVSALMDAKPGTPESDELDVLASLVEHYEDKKEDHQRLQDSF